MHHYNLPSIWLSPWLTLALSGSLSLVLSGAHRSGRVAIVYPSLYGGSNFQVRNYAECGLPYMALSNVSVNQSLRLILC